MHPPCIDCEQEQRGACCTLCLAPEPRDGGDASGDFFYPIEEPRFPGDTGRRCLDRGRAGLGGLDFGKGVWSSRSHKGVKSKDWACAGDAIEGVGMLDKIEFFVNSGPARCPKLGQVKRDKAGPTSNPSKPLKCPFFS